MPELENKEPETVVLDETEPVEDVMPTEEEAGQGEGALSAKEIEMAKEQKLFREPEKKEEKKEPEPKLEKKPEEKKEDVKQIKPDEELSDEEEFNRLREFNSNEKALYFKHKRERRKRQDAERERDTAKARQEIYEKELRLAKENIETIKTGKKSEQESKGDDDLDKILEDDEKKDEKRDEKKYITQEDLDKREKERSDAEQATVARAKKLNERLIEQEKEVLAFNPDYKEVTDLAKEIITKPDEIFKENPRIIGRVKELVKRMYSTAGRAMEEEQDYTAAEIFYEIGQLHPKAKDVGKKPKTADGDAQSAEKKESDIERMLENSRKKGSSASVGSGGGLRHISVNDITPEEAARLSDSEYSKLPLSVREGLLAKL